jgi:hypothetical protein
MGEGGRYLFYSLISLQSTARHSSLNFARSEAESEDCRGTLSRRSLNEGEDEPVFVFPDIQNFASTNHPNRSELRSIASHLQI